MSHRRMTFQRLISILLSKPQSQRQAARRRQLWIAVIMRLVILVFLILLLVLIVTGCKACSRHRKQKAAQQKAAREAEANSGDATIGFTGCMILHQPILDSYQNEDGSYDFSEPYRYIKKYYEKPDVMACEMEGTISDDKNGYSGHPLFRYPDVFPENLESAGIDLQLLATNHVYDGKSTGLKLTLDAYNRNDIKYTGIRSKDKDKRYTIVKAGPVKVGLVDYTYGTQQTFNAIEVDEKDAELINMFKETDPVDFYPEVEEQVKAMKKDGADFIVYVIHWGAEYDMEPSEDQKEIAQELCNRGVDAIIGGHPHVEQPIEVLETEDGAHKMFCIYSIGNAFSNQREGNAMDTPHCEDGAILTLKLHKDKKGKVTYKDIELTPTWVSRESRTGDDTEEETEETQEGENTQAQTTTENAEEEEEDELYDYAILPLDKIKKLEKLTGIKGVEEDAKASYERTMKILGEGLKKAKKELVKK